MSTKSITVTVAITRNHQYQGVRQEVSEVVDLEEGQDREQVITETRNALFRECYRQTDGAIKKVAKAAQEVQS